MNKENIKKYDLKYSALHYVEVVATSLEEAKKIAAEHIEESSKFECSRDLWDALKYESHRVSEPYDFEIEEYLDEHED